MNLERTWRLVKLPKLLMARFVNSFTKGANIYYENCPNFSHTAIGNNFQLFLFLSPSFPPSLSRSLSLPLFLYLFFISLYISLSFPHSISVPTSDCLFIRGYENWVILYHRKQSAEILLHLSSTCMQQTLRL